MRRETVDIFSDPPGVAVVRHPGRNAPGVLVQGDILHALCQQADRACAGVDRHADGYGDLNRLRNTLQDMLTRYKQVLGEHDLPLPFKDV